MSKSGSRIKNLQEPKKVFIKWQKDAMEKAIKHFEGWHYKLGGHDPKAPVKCSHLVTYQNEKKH